MACGYGKQKPIAGRIRTHAVSTPSDSFGCRPAKLRATSLPEGDRVAPRRSKWARGRDRGDLIGDHLEACERAGPERGHYRDVGGIAATCHQGAADARLVVASVKRVPAAAEIGFEPGAEVHR